MIQTLVYHLNGLLQGDSIFGHRMKSIMLNFFHLMSCLIWFLTLKLIKGTSLAVQWLRLCVPKAEGTSSIPGQGTKIPHAV